MVKCVFSLVVVQLADRPAEKVYHEHFFAAEFLMVMCLLRHREHIASLSPVPRCCGAASCQRCDGHDHNEAHHSAS